MASFSTDPGSTEPIALIVPGLGNSGPDHWQTAWQAQRGDCRRVELGMWERPNRNAWVNQINLAVRAAGRPVVLVAHSLGCIAVAWWAQLERELAASTVSGALLVAPPDTDFFPLDDRLLAFAPTPMATLPFPSTLVGSRNDPWLGLHAARRLARVWGSRFIDAGAVGHINAESGLGAWDDGQRLLDGLLEASPSAGAGQPIGMSGQPAALNYRDSAR